MLQARGVAIVNLLHYVRVTFMRRDALLLALTATGSALCWWPVIMEPNLDLPWWLPMMSIDMIEICWLPLALIALLTGLASSLSGGRWFIFVIASSVGTFTGISSAFAIWLTDPETPVTQIVLVETLVTVIVSLVAVLIGRKFSATNGKSRSAVWVAFVCCVALGPVLLTLTPPVVAYRVARNDQLATERFKSLKIAVEKTRAESGDPRRICDGQTLKQNYSGPKFRDQDWSYIAGNYVKEDGYVYGIWIYCREPGNGYTIDVTPERQKGDGTLKFCTDQSGKIGCGINPSSSREECSPCAK